MARKTIPIYFYLVTLVNPLGYEVSALLPETDPDTAKKRAVLVAYQYSRYSPTTFLNTQLTVKSVAYWDRSSTRVLSGFKCYDVLTLRDPRHHQTIVAGVRDLKSALTRVAGTIEYLRTICYVIDKGTYKRPPDNYAAFADYPDIDKI